MPAGTGMSIYNDVNVFPSYVEPEAQGAAMDDDILLDIDGEEEVL